MSRNARFVRGGTAVSLRRPGPTFSSILVWTLTLGPGCAEVQSIPCQGGEVQEGGECVCSAGQSLKDGMCLSEDDPCIGVSCEDGNECTDDTCVVAGGEAICPFSSLDDGTSCNGGAGECEAGQCVARKSISVGCTDNSFSGFSIANWELSVTLDGTVLGGEEFDATLDGTAAVPERVLDILELAAPPGFKRIALADLAATVLVRSGATGDSVTLKAIDLPYTCDMDGTSCDPTKNQPNGANEDCVPTGSFNQCLAFVDLPVVNGTPTSTGGCAPPGVQDCDCSPCEALDADLSSIKSDQCLANGFCVSGPLLLDLEAATGTYTASASGEVLFGWDDQSTGATIVGDGTYDLPPANFPGPAAPNGVRLIVESALFLALQCTMAVDSADPIHGVGVPDEASPTPDELLLSIPIAE